MSHRGVILVVDDTAESPRILTGMLAAGGYDVRPAGTGELALAAIAEIKPDLIILDIQMPGMNGFEVCRRLKADKGSRDIPVMFVSAIDELEERVHGLTAGAVDFVSRPFSSEELLARVGSHVELSRLKLRLERMVAGRTAALKAANEQLQVELAERIRAEQALRESEARFRSMADTAPVGIWTSGPDLKIKFCNRYALAFTGRTLQELARDRWTETVHPEDVERKHAESIPAIEARRAHISEYRVRRADGEYRWMLDTATPRFLDNGDFAGYIGVMIDITEMRHHREKLLAAQKLESLGVLVPGVAHNFGNLVGAILSEADLALTDVPPESDGRTSVERIYNTALQMSEIVSLLTAYAGQIGSGASGLVNLSQVVEQTLRLFRATVSKNVELCLSVDRSLPVIQAEISQIRQLVVNLLTNACESLQNRKGQVRLATSCVGISREDLAGYETKLSPGNFVRLEVTDTGCGIDERVRNRIFDPFYTTKATGRGLGLAAVQGIVHTLGGAIQVQSTPGAGSTFEILLPCSAYKAAAAGRSESL